MLFTEPVWPSCVLLTLSNLARVKFEIFSSNVRAKMNDISWMTVDIFHYLTLLQMQNLALQ